MIRTILHNSMVGRGVRGIRRLYTFSLMAAFIDSFRRAYKNGRTRPVVESVFGCQPTMTLNSWWARILTYLNSALARLGRSVEHVVGNSLLVRGWRSGVVRDSLTYRLLFSRGMNRLIIIAFALYLPIDWVLRTYSPIAVAASLWDEAFLLFGVGYVLFQRVAARPAKQHSANPLDVPILAFFGVGLLIMGVTSPSISIAVSGFRAVVQYMVWFYVLTRIVDNDEDMLIFCATLAAIGLLTALHGVYQYIIGVEIPTSWVSQAEAGVRTRVFSIFGSPNIMGSFMVMSALPAAGFAYFAKRTPTKIAAWICAGIMGVACLLTFSRGGWLAFGVAAAVFAWLKDKRLIALILFAGGVAVFALPDVVGRITFLFTKEFAVATKYGGREGRWREGYLLLQNSNIMFGFGLGRFGGAVAMQNQTEGYLSYFYMDNYYMKTLVEMGYVGLVSYVALVVTTLFTGLRAVFRTKGTALHSVAAALTAAMAGVLIHCLYENIFEVPYMNAYFWGIAAMLVYIGFLRKPGAVAKGGI